MRTAMTRMPSLFKCPQKFFWPIIWLWPVESPEMVHYLLLLFLRFFFFFFRKNFTSEAQPGVMSWRAQILSWRQQTLTAWCLFETSLDHLVMVIVQRHWLSKKQSVLARKLKFQASLFARGCKQRAKYAGLCFRGLNNHTMHYVTL